MIGLANYDPHEGSVTTTTTITFKWRARQITIINDSATRSLEYKFSSSESYGTLKPNEELSLNHLSRTVYLNSPDAVSVAYRVWGFG